MMDLVNHGSKIYSVVIRPTWLTNERALQFAAIFDRPSLHRYAVIPSSRTTFRTSEVGSQTFDGRSIVWLIWLTAFQIEQ
jgi:hypothetical protein